MACSFLAPPDHGSPCHAGQRRFPQESKTMTVPETQQRAMQRIRADVRVAHAAYDSARTQAAHSRNEVLRLHTELSQETLLRYNGMLKSTWDLLASVRTRIDSVDAALQAQRQRWLAHADLMAVLAGLPYADSVSASESSSPSNTRTPGH